MRGAPLAAMLLLGGCGGHVGSDASDSSGGGFSSGGTGGGSGGTPGLGGGSACTVAAAGDLAGEYLFASSMVVGNLTNNVDNPIVFLNTVTASGSTLTWELQPLSAFDRKTPTGDATTVPDVWVSSDGHFDVDPPPIDLPAESNSLSGSPLVLDFTSVRGRLCMEGGFFCGQVDGQVTKPIPLSVDGSTFTMEKIEGGVYPEPPKTDCSGALAKPVGS